MNRDDIIRMAEESGGQDQRFTPETGCQGFWIIHIDGLEHFADLVAAAEREACAQMFDRVYEEMVRIFHLNDPDHPWNTDETRDSAEAAFYYAEDIRLMKHHRKPAVPIGRKS